MLSDKLKTENDILEVASRLTKMSRKGKDYFGCCPFHAEDTPSFKVDRSSGKFKCFGCGKSGSVVDLLALEQNIPVQALLSGCADSDSSEQADGLAVNRELTAIYHDRLLVSDGDIEALHGRGVSDEAIIALHLGLAGDSWQWATDKISPLYSQDAMIASGSFMPQKSGERLFDVFRNRIVFPITSTDGAVRGFSGRTTINEEPKYYNTKNCAVYNKSRHLYLPAGAVKEARESGRMILVEGAFDAAVVWSFGHHNVAAILGTAVTSSHAKTLAGLVDTVYLAFDGDAAGRKGIMSAIPELLGAGLDVMVVNLPDGKDPAEYCQMACTMNGALEAAITWDMFVFMAMKGNGAPRDKANLASTFKEMLSHISDVVLKRETGKQVAKMCEIQLGDIVDVEVIETSEPEYDETAAPATNLLFEDSLDLPDNIVDPGGLISEGMEALSVPGLPSPWHYKLPVVLSVIGRAITGKIRHTQAMPNFYHVIIAPSGSGKSAANEEMSLALGRNGLSDILGPERFASAQAIFSALQNIGPNLLCFLDEVSGLLSSGGTKDGSMQQQQAEALLELYSKSGKTAGKYRLNYSSRDRNVTIDGLLSFSFCGCATPRCFSKLTGDALENGLFSRVNVFYREGFVEQRGIKDNSNKLMDNFCAKIHQMLQANATNQENGGVCVSTERVTEELDMIDKWCANTINYDPTNDARNSFATKVYLDSIRYALVHIASSRQLWCISDPMEHADIMYGFTLAKALAEWKMNVLLSKVHGGDFETDWKEFIAGIKAAGAKSKDGFVSIRSIADRRRRTQNWTPKRWDEVTGHLLKMGKITSRPGKNGDVYALVVK